MVLVRFEPLNSIQILAIYFVFSGKLLGNFQFLVSVIPASYWGNSSVQGRFCRQAIGDIPFRRSCCCDKLGNSKVWLLGNSTLEGFESVSLPLQHSASKAAATRP